MRRGGNVEGVGVERRCVVHLEAEGRAGGVSLAVRAGRRVRRVVRRGGGRGRVLGGVPEGRRRRGDAATEEPRRHGCGRGARVVVTRERLRARSFLTRPRDHSASGADASETRAGDESRDASASPRHDAASGPL